MNERIATIQKWAEAGVEIARDSSDLWRWRPRGVLSTGVASQPFVEFEDCVRHAEESFRTMFMSNLPLETINGPQSQTFRRADDYRGDRLR